MTSLADEWAVMRDGLLARGVEPELAEHLALVFYSAATTVLALLARGADPDAIADELQDFFAARHLVGEQA